MVLVELIFLVKRLTTIFAIILEGARKVYVLYMIFSVIFSVEYLRTKTTFILQHASVTQNLFNVI